MRNSGGPDSNGTFASSRIGEVPTLKQLAVTQIAEPRAESSTGADSAISMCGRQIPDWPVHHHTIVPARRTPSIPTDAINHLNGRELVFIENPTPRMGSDPPRVGQQSFRTFPWCDQAHPEEKSLSKFGESKGRYPIGELQPGERVITPWCRGLTSALEETSAQRRAACEKLGGHVMVRRLVEWALNSLHRDHTSVAWLLPGEVTRPQHR